MYRTSRLLALGLLLGLALPAPAQAGTLKGTISVKRARSPKNAVVYVKGVPWKGEPPKEHALMDQKNLEFVPHVLPILNGTSVDFLNSDDVLHNVFSPDETAHKFNLGTWPKGETRTYEFDTDCDLVCSAVMLCNVHPEMEAYVIVLKNPYYALVGKDGVYEIPDIPAGTYEVGIWHEKLKAKPQKVTIPKEGEVTLDFTLTR